MADSDMVGFRWLGRYQYVEGMKLEHVSGGSTRALAVAPCGENCYVFSTYIFTYIHILVKSQHKDLVNVAGGGLDYTSTTLKSMPSRQVLRAASRLPHC